MCSLFILGHWLLYGLDCANAMSSKRGSTYGAKLLVSVSSWWSAFWVLCFLLRLSDVSIVWLQYSRNALKLSGRLLGSNVPLSE